MGEKISGFGGCGEKGGGRRGIRFQVFFFFFFFLNLEDLGFLEKKIKKLLFLPRVTNVAATSTLNGSMDGKCNGCIILK